jgi:hypothetical protein
MSSQSEIGVGLADAIGTVRRELEAAIEAGLSSDVAFRAGSIELEFEVVFERTVSGDAGVRVWVVSVGGAGATSTSRTNRLKVILTPIDRTGGESQIIGGRVSR